MSETLEHKRARLSELYDYLYEQGQALFDKYDPCKFTPTPKGTVLCAEVPGRVLAPIPALGTPATPLRVHDDVCCTGCKHLGSMGCTVKALGCKLWLCSGRTKLYPELANKLLGLRKEAEFAGVPMGIRTSKETNFQLWTEKELLKCKSC